MAIVKQNFSVTPPNIIINNIKPGMDYQAILNFSGQNINNPSLLNFTEYGEVANMFEIGTPALNKTGNVDLISVPITIHIPEKISPGVYQGSIMALLKNNDKNENAMAINSQIAHEIPIQIKVTDRNYEEIVVSNISFISGLVKNSNTANNITVISMKASVTNNGNIANKPAKLQLIVYDQEMKRIITEFNTANLPPLLPFSSNNFAVDLFGKLPAGNYLGIIKAYGTTHNKPIYSQKLMLTISNTSQEIRYPILRIDENGNKSNYLIIAGIISIIIIVGIISFRRYRLRQRIKNSLL